MHEDERRRRTGELLRALAESTPSDRDGLRAWYLQARNFHDFTREHSIGLPHFVHHYLADADIRVRDAAYRTPQQALILKIILAYERGELPEGS